MTNFIKRQLDALYEIHQQAQTMGHSESNVVFTRMMHPDVGDVAPATQYIKRDTEEYFHIANDQWSIIPRSNDTNLTDILTEAGLELYHQAEAQFRNNQYKDVFVKYFPEQANSGFWSADTESPYYTEGESHTYLNSFNNTVVNGLSARKNVFITTSPVIFLTDNWCLTRSKSLYKLGDKISADDFYPLLSKYNPV